jgi:hypothetical protein
MEDMHDTIETPLRNANFFSKQGRRRLSISQFASQLLLAAFAFSPTQQGPIQRLMQI